MSAGVSWQCQTAFGKWVRLSIPVPELFGKTDEPSGIMEASERICHRCRYSGGYHTAYTAAFVCGAYDCGRCGFAGGPGDAWSFGYFHNTDIYGYGGGKGEKFLSESPSKSIIGLSESGTVPYRKQEEV